MSTTAVLDDATDLTITDDTWLQVACPPLARWYWLQVDGAVGLRGVAASATLTDAQTPATGGMKLGVGVNVVLPLPAGNEAKSLWIRGDGASTTGRIFTSLDRINVSVG